MRRRAQLLRNSLEELIELSSLGQTEFNTVIKVKYYGHMARVINKAVIYEEKRHTHTHTHTKTHNTHIKLEGWALIQSTSIY